MKQRLKAKLRAFRRRILGAGVPTQPRRNRPLRPLFTQ